MRENLTQHLFKDIAYIIEQGKLQVSNQVNSVLTITYWHIGNTMNNHILHNDRAEYGERLVESIAADLVKHYGRSYTLRNLRRMMQFAQVFPDLEIVSSLMSQLSWTHFIELLPLKSDEQRMFYANRIATERWSVRTTRYQIDRKAYERNEIADMQVPNELEAIKNTFKDPYFLDFLGLKDGYLESDLESAIIKELEHFILELGTGFTFVERQKRLILDGKDYYIDLLFYHRKLKRLVAVELKLNEFKAA